MPEATPAESLNGFLSLLSATQSHTASSRSLVSCAQIRYVIKAIASTVAWLAVTLLAISAVKKVFMC